MESKNCKRLKREEADGVRADGEGNVTACLAVPLLEENISGTETCFYEGFEFRAALFLIHDIRCGPLSLLHMHSNGLNTNPIFTISFCSYECNWTGGRRYWFHPGKDGEHPQHQSSQRRR